MAHSRFLDGCEERGRLLIPLEGYEDYPLLSLEEAAEPIQHLCQNLLAKVWIIKEQRENLPDDFLSIDEVAAIQLYTLEWNPSHNTVYYQLNDVLRSKEREQLISPWFLYLKLFLTALFKLQSVQTTIWRGVRGDLSEQYPGGKKVIWWGFSSCTESIEVLEIDKFLGKDGDRTLFSIQCLNGKSIKKYSSFSENEMLLMPATYLEVISILHAANGLHIIHLKELIPPYELLKSPSKK
ncbi:unnamed protein product, partial [Didymodactylos carnosus]